MKLRVLIIEIIFTKLTLYFTVGKCAVRKNVTRSIMVIILKKLIISLYFEDMNIFGTIKDSFGS